MKKKLLFVIYSIYGGGAEKQMQYLLKYIDRGKFEPHLAVFHLTGKENKVVPADIPVYDLSTAVRPASFFLFFKLIGLIKKIKPDRILSFMWGVNLISILAGKLTGIKLIVSERTFMPLDIKKYSFQALRRQLISFLYRKANRITAVSNDVKRALIDYFSLPEEKIKVIYNGLDIKKIHAEMNEYCSSFGRYVLGCGRLEKEKNFDLILQAMLGIPGLKLVILGEGSLRKELAKKAEKLGVELVLPGHIENPYPWMRKAEVFILTSRYEGSPNVLLEAMACKIPVVSVDCPGGIREIIENGRNGIIVPQGNKNELISAIRGILKNSEFAKKLSEKALGTVKKFDMLNMVKKYEEILS